jgi:hypothetical protein
MSSGAFIVALRQIFLVLVEADNEIAWYFLRGHESCVANLVTVVVESYQ